MRFLLRPTAGDRLSDTEPRLTPAAGVLSCAIERNSPTAVTPARGLCPAGSAIHEAAAALVTYTVVPDSKNVVQDFSSRPACQTTDWNSQRVWALFFLHRYEQTMLVR